MFSEKASCARRYGGDHEWEDVTQKVFSVKACLLLWFVLVADTLTVGCVFFAFSLDFSQKITITELLL